MVEHCFNGLFEIMASSLGPLAPDVDVSIVNSTEIDGFERMPFRVCVLCHEDCRFRRNRGGRERHEPGLRAKKHMMLIGCAGESVGSVVAQDSVGCLGGVGVDQPKRNAFRGELRCQSLNLGDVAVGDRAVGGEEKEDDRSLRIVLLVDRKLRDLTALKVISVGTRRDRAETAE